jgi:hypothetical protein
MCNRTLSMLLGNGVLSKSKIQPMTLFNHTRQNQADNMMVAHPTFHASGCNATLPLRRRTAHIADCLPQRPAQSFIATLVQSTTVAKLWIASMELDRAAASPVGDPPGSLMQTLQPSRVHPTIPSRSARRPWLHPGHFGCKPLN